MITNIDKELCIDGRIASVYTIVDTMAQKMSAEENIHTKKLRLRLCKDGMITAIFDQFPILSSTLKIFVMDQCTIDQSDAQTIANFITISSLSKLELAYCSILSEELSTTICSTIICSIEKSSVQKLKLQGYYIGENVARGIISAITKPNLIELSLISCTFDENALLFILDSIKRSALKVLILEHTRFDDRESTAIADCIENLTLSKLSLRHSNFDGDKIFMIQEAIKKSSSIKILNVRGTTFFTSAKQKISLMKNLEITNLDICCTPFTEIAKVVESVQANCSIRKVSFYSAHGSHNFVIALCDLIENSSVENLELQHYYLSDEEIAKICSSIKLSSIVSLNLGNNHLSTGKMLALCDLLENHDLQKLTIGCHTLTSHAVDLMMPSIRQSTLIKFNVDVGSYLNMNESTQRAIKEHLLEQKYNSNSFYKKKSARTI